MLGPETAIGASALRGHAQQFRLTTFAFTAREASRSGSRARVREGARVWPAARRRAPPPQRRFNRSYCAADSAWRAMSAPTWSHQRSDSRRALPRRRGGGARAETHTRTPESPPHRIDTNFLDVNDSLLENGSWLISSPGTSPTTRTSRRAHRTICSQTHARRTRVGKGPITRHSKGLWKSGCSSSMSPLMP
jgi:hypothetical protein